jgi:ubiquinone/menaquinone biosynthesis C-methylase UbiE
LNYKLLFPTYRTRFCFLREVLESLRTQESCLERVLHLGTGEGDYDRTIQSYAGKLVSCDINRRDIEFARQLNSDLPQIEYKLEDAQSLSFQDSSFDLVISIDVLEHVEDSQAMVKEIDRVLKPGGLAIISFPSLDFPFTYDPLNRVLARFGTHLPVGAYGFGHFKLLNSQDFAQMVQDTHLTIVQENRLTGYLAALTEMYWPGLLQKVWKANSSNQPQAGRGGFQLRPTNQEPPLLFLTDALITLDRLLFGRSRASVGLAYILCKASPPGSQ